MTEVLNETDYDIDCAEFAALADYVLTQMHVASDAELNILFIGAGIGSVVGTTFASLSTLAIVLVALLAVAAASVGAVSALTRRAAHD